MRTLAAALLAAAVAAAEEAPPKPDTAAEDLVKKVEEKVASAKTVSIALTMDVNTASEKRKFAIKLQFKEGNKVALHVDDADPAAKSGYSLAAVCDGKRVSRADPDGQAVEDAPADLAAKARELAVRAPLRELTMALGGRPSKTPCKYSDFKFLDDEKVGERAARVVSYTCTRGKAALQMKLWIDAEKLEVLKRETLDKKGDVENRVTDTFSAMAYDGDIADETFATPPEKGGHEPEEKK